MRPASQIAPEAWATPLEHLLASYASLRDEHREFIRGRLAGPKDHKAENVEVAGSPSERHAVLLVSGWAAAAIHLEDGRRQIVSLFIPGDLIDPELDLRIGLSAQALTPLKIVDARALANAMAGELPPEMQSLKVAWSLVRAAAEARLVRQVVRLGRLSAYERTADLLLDLHERQQRAGLAERDGMRLPLTQEMLADHLGLSVVHMNRTLQHLRRERLIDYRGGRMLIPEPARLDAVRRRTGAP